MQFNEDNKSVTETIDILAADVVKYMTEQGLTASAAESCTGGLISAAITSVPGASKVFIGGAVTYAEQMKVKLLGVSEKTLERFTVYSEQTALEMCSGVRRITGSDYAVAVTGLAGPDGGSKEKPVGTVYAAVCSEKRSVVKNLALYNEPEYEKLDRRSIRDLTVLRTLELLQQMLMEDEISERNGN
ncbi:MAG: CinA family protein [Oscillospiraceae bacterium]